MHERQEKTIMFETGWLKLLVHSILIHFIFLNNTAQAQAWFFNTLLLTCIKQCERKIEVWSRMKA